MIHLNSMRTAIDEMGSDAVYEENMRYADRIIANLNLLERSNNELKSFGLYTEDRDVLYTESVGDAIRKLGEHIINIVNKAIDLWKEITGKIKAIIFKSKSTDKQIEKIAKKNPEAAEKIKVAIELGNFKMADIKDLNAFYRDMDNIIDEIDKANADQKTLRAKIDKAARKINNSQSLKAAMAILGLGAAATGAYVGYKNLQKAARGGDKRLEQITDRATEVGVKCKKKAEIYRTMEANAVKNPDNVVVSRLHMLTTVASLTDKVTTREHRALYSFLTAVTGKLNTVETKLLKLGSGRGYERARNSRITDMRDNRKKYTEVETNSVNYMKELNSIKNSAKV